MSNTIDSTYAKNVQLNYGRLLSPRHLNPLGFADPHIYVWLKESTTSGGLGLQCFV